MQLFTQLELLDGINNNLIWLSCIMCSYEKNNIYIKKWIIYFIYGIIAIGTFSFGKLNLLKPVIANNNENYVTKREYLELKHSVNERSKEINKKLNTIVVDVREVKNDFKKVNEQFVKIMWYIGQLQGENKTNGKINSTKKNNYTY